MKITTVFAAVAILSIFAFSSAIFQISANAHSPTASTLLSPQILGVTIKSSMWAGYGVKALSSGIIKGVSGSWIQQKVTCDSKAATPQGELDLAALNGVGSKNNFWAVGTEAFCPKGASSPVYSEYATLNGKAVAMGPKILIVPGHKYEAYIQAGTTPNSYNYGLFDISAGKTSAAAVFVVAAVLLYAEIIIALLSNTGTYVPPAAANLIKFGLFFTAIASTCDYDDDGVDTPIGSSGSSLVIPMSYTMYNPALTKLYAVPSPLKSDLESYSIAIKATG